MPHYREVKFEQLVLEPEGTLRELCEYLELAGDPSMLRYHERAQERIGEVITEYRAEGLPVVTVEQRHSIHRLTGRPPDASRIGVWRRELTDHEAAAFEAIAGEALAGLGYEVRSTAAHGSPAA